MANTRGNFQLKFELCYLNNAAILNFFINMAETRGMYKPNLLLFRILALLPFWIWENMADTCGNFELNFQLVIVIARPFVNMADTRGNFKPNLNFYYLYRAAIC
jgi:hypothetical protein